MTPTPAKRASQTSPAKPRAGLRPHLPLYLYEGAELGLFMLSACAFTVLLFHPASPALHALPSPTLRRALMGLFMGLTAVLIIHSPMGKRSGAQFNPAITLTFLRLGKIGLPDALFYIAFQFAGGILGVALAYPDLRLPPRQPRRPVRRNRARYLRCPRRLRR